MAERIVIKIGGATLFQPNGFETELRKLLSQNQNAQVWLMAGGGDLVETMRNAHQIYPKLDDEEMHWRCVELLDYTWSIAKEVFQTDYAVTSREDLERLSNRGRASGTCWVRVQSFYSRENCGLIPDSWLPRSNWSTTSDVLAWLLGMMIDADRVILMKQCECDRAWTIAEAAHRGVIDSESSRLVDANPGVRPIIELVGRASQ